MDENLDMSLFGQDDNFELNYDFTPDEDLEDENLDESSETDDKTNNNTVDGDNDDQGEVDGEEDDQDEGNEDDDENNGDSSSNLYSSVAAVLHEQGLLPSLDIENNKIESVDDFVNTFRAEQFAQAKAMAEDYLNSIDVESIQRSRAEIQDLNAVTEESLRDNLDHAKQIVYQDYLNQGLDQAKVDRLLNRLTDLGEDAILEEAKDSLESLKEFNARKIEAEKESYEKRLEEEKIAQEKLEADIIAERCKII